MKKLLFILLLCPLFTLSQTKVEPDTIKLPTPVAKAIAKDLVSYDSLKAIHKLTVDELNLTKEKTSVQSSIIKAHEEKGIMYEQRITNEQEKYKVQGKWLEDLRKDNKKLKTELRFVKILTVAITGGLTYLYIKK